MTRSVIHVWSLHFLMKWHWQFVCSVFPFSPLKLSCFTLLHCSDLWHETLWEDLEQFCLNLCGAHIALLSFTALGTGDLGMSINNVNRSAWNRKKLHQTAWSSRPRETVTRWAVWFGLEGPCKDSHWCGWFCFMPKKLILDNVMYCTGRCLCRRCFWISVLFTVECRSYCTVMCALRINFHMKFAVILCCMRICVLL
jgi:hypothetical protein